MEGDLPMSMFINNMETEEILSKLSSNQKQEIFNALNKEQSIDLSKDEINQKLDSIIKDAKMFDQAIHSNDLDEKSFFFLMEKAKEVYNRPENEDLLINNYNNSNYTAIYQLKAEFQHEYGFESSKNLKSYGLIDTLSDITKDRYELVGIIERIEDLNAVFAEYNREHHEGFLGHSLSTSDVVIQSESPFTKKAFMVDSYGFTELPNFFHIEDIALNNNIEALSNLELQAMLYEFSKNGKCERYGNFFIENAEGTYTGIANETGDMWMEDFKNLENCVKYLLDEPCEMLDGEIWREDLLPNTKNSIEKPEFTKDSLRNDLIDKKSIEKEATEPKLEQKKTDFSL